MTMQPVRSIDESLADPAFFEDGCATETTDAELGTIRTVGNAFNMSKTQGKPGKPAVKPGANTDEVKAEAAKIIADAKAATAASNAGKRIRAPLEGITVLDLGLAIAGPFGTQLLRSEEHTSELQPLMR